MFRGRWLWDTLQWQPNRTSPAIQIFGHGCSLYTEKKPRHIFRKSLVFLYESSESHIHHSEKGKIFKLLPPEIRFDIFDTMIKPILTYGSDVWGINKTALHELDKSFLNYIHCVLCVKSTTSFWWMWEVSPSMYCHINVLCYIHRLLKMQSGQVVDSLHKWNNQGFHTWVSKAYELSQ